MGAYRYTVGTSTNDKIDGEDFSYRLVKLYGDKPLSGADLVNRVDAEKPNAEF